MTRHRASWLLRATLKWGLFLLGLFLLALGSSMMITAELGVSTWDVLHLGLQKRRRYPSERSSCLSVYYSCSLNTR